MGGCYILICNKGDYYSYESCYCDDLIVVQKDPDHLFDSIRKKRFTIKEMLDPYYFLEGDSDHVKDPKTV